MAMDFDIDDFLRDFDPNSLNDIDLLLRELGESISENKFERVIKKWKKNEYFCF